MDQKLITAILTGALVLWVLYRRVSRNIGRQAVTPVRMQLRMLVLVAIGALLAIPAASDLNLLGGLLAGTVAGATLGWFGLRHTRFERTDEGVFYTPHTYIGLAVSALLISRLVYRFFIVYPTMQAASQADQNPFAAFQRSPLTLAIFGVLIGYYILYYAGVLGTSRNLLRTSSGPVA